MHLTLILGPMKSGKSFDLISRFSHLKYAKIPFGLFQSSRNVRDAQIFSRNGNLQLEAKKVASLSEINEDKFKVIGIDEVHMFAKQDVLAVERFLKRGVEVVASGLDLDYQGRLFGIVKKLLELGPKEVKYRQAVCEQCQSLDAVYSQILKGGQAVLEGLPAIMPDDGSYDYQPRCRRCFQKNIKI